MVDELSAAERDDTCMTTGAVNCGEVEWSYTVDHGLVKYHAGLSPFFEFEQLVIEDIEFKFYREVPCWPESIFCCRGVHRWFDNVWARTPRDRERATISTDDADAVEVEAIISGKILQTHQSLVAITLMLTVLHKSTHQRLLLHRSTIRLLSTLTVRKSTPRLTMLQPSQPHHPLDYINDPMAPTPPTYSFTQKRRLLTTNIIVHSTSGTPRMTASYVIRNPNTYSQRHLNSKRPTDCNNPRDNDHVQYIPPRLH
jgi:hypothetical protein